MTSDLSEPRIYNSPASKTIKTIPKNLHEIKLFKQSIGMISISKIINDKNLKKSFPTQFNKTEELSIIYTLNKTIRSNICRFENLPIWSCSYKNNTLKISLSYS